MFESKIVAFYVVYDTFKAFEKLEKLLKLEISELFAVGVWMGKSAPLKRA